MTRHLCNAIEVNLESIRSDLVRIEVVESPVRTFIIDRCL
ncbi:MAG TPA: hypothetical protein H9792_08045 [Candidatus Limosilactobacillus excrementigallinarum]|nr:hypothetical protein [Candidatus Limosilactobacillus excrementigallinarum]